MGGGLLQLITIGAQDVYITGDPQITFFKLVYRRHTNFAIESRMQQSAQSISSGETTNIDIKREADLINHMYLRIENPVSGTNTTEYKKTIARTLLTNVVNQNLHVLDSTAFKVNMDVMITAGVKSTTNSTIPMSIYRTTIIGIDHANNILTITGKYPVIKDASTSYIASAGNFHSSYDLHMGFILPKTTVSTLASGLAAATIAAFEVVEVKGWGNEGGIDDEAWFAGTDVYTGASGIRGLAIDSFRLSVCGDTMAESATPFTSKIAGNGVPYDMVIQTGSGRTACWSTTDATYDTCCDDNVNGYHMIDSIELQIGGQKIDKMYGDLLDMWNQLTITNGNKQQFNLMTDVDDSKYTYLPLYFWFNKTPGLALPLIALQYHTISVNIKWNSNLPIHSQTAKLFVDYVFLDSAERRRFAQSPHEYLVETWQQHSHNNLKVSDTVRIHFNHPVKEIMWRARLPNDNYCSWDQITLKFNNNDRLSQRHGDYFMRVQPFYHHNAIPSKAHGIHCYSFAIKPEEHQPSGTCNFSRLDDVTLDLNTAIKMDGRTSETFPSTGTKLNIYVINYNVLRIMSGLGQLAFAN
jgi:hypothetical protein